MHRITAHYRFHRGHRAGGRSRLHIAVVSPTVPAALEAALLDQAYPVLQRPALRPLCEAVQCPGRPAEDPTVTFDRCPHCRAFVIHGTLCCALCYADLRDAPAPTGTGAELPRTAPTSLERRLATCFQVLTGG